MHRHCGALLSGWGLGAGRRPAPCGRCERAATAPPRDWSIERKRQYFDWAKKSIDQLRGTNPKLERRFDQLYPRRPKARWTDAFGQLLILETIFIAAGLL
jgi:hypothetical protein